MRTFTTSELLETLMVGRRIRMKDGNNAVFEGVVTAIATISDEDLSIAVICDNRENYYLLSELAIQTRSLKL